MWNQKCLICVFLGCNLKILLSCFKSAPSIWSCCKVWCKIKIFKFGTKNALFWCFCAGIWKKLLSYLKSAPSYSPDGKFREKTKMSKFETKNVWFWIFLGWKFRKLLPYLKSAPSNLSKCKILWRNKNA